MWIMMMLCKYTKMATRYGSILCLSMLSPISMRLPNVCRYARTRRVINCL